MSEYRRTPKPQHRRDPVHVVGPGVQAQDQSQARGAKARAMSAFAASSTMASCWKPCSSWRKGHWSASQLTSLARVTLRQRWRRECGALGHLRAHLKHSRHWTSLLSRQFGVLRMLTGSSLARGATAVRLMYIDMRGKRGAAECPQDTRTSCLRCAWLSHSAMAPRRRPQSSNFRSHLSSGLPGL